MKKNNLYNMLKMHKRKFLITLLSLLGLFLTVTVVENSKSIINAIYYGTAKPSNTTKHTPQRLQWIDSFKGVNNMKNK